MITRFSLPSVLCLLPFVLLPFAQAQPAETEPAASPPASPAKYLLIEFFSYNTMESKINRDLIINSGAVSKLIKDNYRLISVEQGKDPEKENRYKITRYPTLVIAKPDGAEIDRIVGLRTPAEVVETLKAATAGRSEFTRVREQAATPGGGINARLLFATALRLREDMEGAFREYLWILDNGETTDPKSYSSMFRVVIQQLAILGREYPPAMEELKKRQESIESAAASEAATPETIGRAFAMNEALGMTSRNVSLYLKIPADNPLKRSLFSDIFPALVNEGKYREAAEVADLEDFVGSQYPRFRSEPKRQVNDGHNHAAPISSMLKRRITTYAAAACESLIALGQIDKAKRVAGRAIDYLGKDNQSFIARLNSIVAKPSAAATDFPAWLKSYLQTTKPEAP